MKLPMGTRKRWECCAGNGKIKLHECGTFNLIRMKVHERS